MDVVTLLEYGAGIKNFQIPAPGIHNMTLHQPNLPDKIAVVRINMRSYYTLLCAP